jgi:hypothetical protein
MIRTFYPALHRLHRTCILARAFCLALALSCMFQWGSIWAFLQHHIGNRLKPCLRKGKRLSCKEVQFGLASSDTSGRRVVSSAITTHESITSAFNQIKFVWDSREGKLNGSSNVSSCGQLISCSLTFYIKFIFLILSKLLSSQICN